MEHMESKSRLAVCVHVYMMYMDILIEREREILRGRLRMGHIKSMGRKMDFKSKYLDDCIITLSKTVGSIYYLIQ